jgi:hypothetical protein
VRHGGDDDNAARHYRLSSVQLCANAPAAPGSFEVEGLVCMPPTRFDWRNRAAPETPTQDQRYGRPTFDQYLMTFDAALTRRERCGTNDDGQVVFCDSIWPTVALDANGDGADDLLYLRETSDGVRRLALRLGGYQPRQVRELDASRPEDLPLSAARILDVELRSDRPDRVLDRVVDAIQWADSVDWDLDGRDDLVLMVPAIGEPLWEVVVALATRRPHASSSHRLGSSSLSASGSPSSMMVASAGP